MDGYIAKLKDIRALADRYDALIMVDDCHATGFLGPQGPRLLRLPRGRGSTSSPAPSARRWAAPWAASSARKAEVVALLKQRARPYLFSNALAPAVCGSSLEAIRIAGGEEGDALRTQLFANAARYRAGHDRGRLQPAARRASDHSGDAGRRQAGPGLRRAGCSSWASMSSASASRSCPGARRASAPRCRRRTPSNRSIRPSPRSRRPDANWELSDGGHDEGPGQDAARSRPRADRRARSRSPGPRTC